MDRIKHQKDISKHRRKIKKEREKMNAEILKIMIENPCFRVVLLKIDL